MAASAATYRAERVTPGSGRPLSGPELRVHRSVANATADSATIPAVRHR